MRHSSLLLILCLPGLSGAKKAKKWKKDEEDTTEKCMWDNFCSEKSIDARPQLVTLIEEALSTKLVSLAYPVIDYSYGLQHIFNKLLES